MGQQEVAAAAFVRLERVEASLGPAVPGEASGGSPAAAAGQQALEVGFLEVEVSGAALQGLREEAATEGLAAE